MDIKAKMNGRFRDLQGGLFLEVTKADVGEGAGNFMKAGGDIMAWADPFFPDPAIPESVKKAMHEAIDGGSRPITACPSASTSCARRWRSISQSGRAFPSTPAAMSS